MKIGKIMISHWTSRLPARFSGSPSWKVVCFGKKGLGLSAMEMMEMDGLTNWWPNIVSHLRNLKGSNQTIPDKLQAHISTG